MGCGELTPRGGQDAGVGPQTYDEGPRRTADPRVLPTPREGPQNAGSRLVVGLGLGLADQTRPRDLRDRAGHADLHRAVGLDLDRLGAGLGLMVRTHPAAVTDQAHEPQLTLADDAPEIAPFR